MSLVVTAIRHLDDGAFRYETAALEPDGEGVILDEVDLIQTGERVGVEHFGVMPGGLRSRDVAQVASDYDDEDVAGRTVVVDHNWGDEDGVVVVGVWCPSTEVYAYVPLDVLTTAGERLDPPVRGRRGGSTLVGEDGSVLGQVGFTVIDELEQYL